MRTPKLFLGIFALALILPLMLLACGGPDEPTDGTSQERSTDAPVPATAPPAASGSAETDREALVAIYNATDGENWNRSDNWLSDAPLDEWEGVTTDDEGRVTKLEVKGNQLTGEIPAELGDLANLTELWLASNQLTGCIPAGLRNIRVNDFGQLGLPFCGS